MSESSEVMLYLTAPQDTRKTPFSAYFTVHQTPARSPHASRTTTPRAAHLPGFAGDLLNGAHEDVSDDGDPKEAVKEADEVQEGSHLQRPRVLGE